MNPTGEEPRANRVARGEEAHRHRRPSEARRAVIDQFCDRFSRDFDETVFAIESILGVRSKTTTPNGESSMK